MLNTADEIVSSSSVKSSPPSISPSRAGLPENRSDFEFRMPKSLGNLPVLTLSGTPQEMGEEHGRRLRYCIRKCAQTYDIILSSLSSAERNEFVLKQRKLLEVHFPQYAEEICALAKGANISEEIAFSLNSRTELAIYQHTLKAVRGEFSQPVHECTLVGSTNTRIMGQTWDWSSDIERVTLLSHIKRSDGHRILTLTEPGIIGKIGMNSAGIGVGLNFIPGNFSGMGLPVHLLLRACLDASSFEQISEIMDEFSRKRLLGTMSAISVMDRKGNAEVFEILGDELVRTRNQENSIFTHTNHPIFKKHRLEVSAYTDIENSEARLNCANRMSSQGSLDINLLGQILGDRSSPDHPINMPAVDWAEFGKVKTISTLMYDLENGMFYVSKGAPGDSDSQVRFESVKLY